jgi:hypothetical protein
MVINAQHKFKRAEHLHIAEQMARFDAESNILAQSYVNTDQEEKLIAVNDQYKPLNFATQQYKIVNEEEE